MIYIYNTYIIYIYNINICIYRYIYIVHTHFVENHTGKIIETMSQISFKACVHYFLLNFYFSPNENSSKTMKNAFYFI